MTFLNANQIIHLAIDMYRLSSNFPVEIFTTIDFYQSVISSTNSKRSEAEIKLWSDLPMEEGMSNTNLCSLTPFFGDQLRSLSHS